LLPTTLINRFDRSCGTFREGGGKNLLLLTTLVNLPPKEKHEKKGDGSKCEPRKKHKKKRVVVVGVNQKKNMKRKSMVASINLNFEPWNGN
jgi:hypothetical protein